MRRLLIISPNFPPINSPDMHRVRMSLSHFAEFGWEPIVLAVDPACVVERVVDPILLETIPSDVPVHRTAAFDVHWTRKLGVSTLALRALPFLYIAGTRLMAKDRPDLVYFSTTSFPVLVLGRIWKRRFGVPFVVDMQDPWVGDYYEKRPAKERPPKYALAQTMHRLLEPFTMRAVDGVIAVTDSYHETLRRRYPWISPDFCRTIPFGASEKDFQVAANMDWHNSYFIRGEGLFHGVCAGALGQTKTETCRALCLAFRHGLDTKPELFSKIRLHFIGTDYAPPEYARPTIRPIAEEYQLEKYIFESPSRVSYLTALSLFRDAYFLVVLGSDDPNYTASKIYPYILAQKPLLCVFHKHSSVISVLEKTRAGHIVSFDENDAAQQIETKLFPALRNFFEALPFVPDTNWKEFEPYRAREMTRRQTELFDRVVQQHRYK